MDAREATWVEALAEFDQREGWRADGCFSCAGWLINRCRMGRSTAYEKVSVAHEVRRRPVIGEALRTGEISYTAARAISRLEDTTPEVDGALVTVARDGTVADLDYAIGYYLVLHGQEHDGRPRWARNESRNVKIRRGFGTALGSAVIALPSDQLAEIRTGLAHANAGGLIGPDRYLVHAYGARPSAAPSRCATAVGAGGRDATAAMSTSTTSTTGCAVGVPMWTMVAWYLMATTR